MTACAESQWPLAGGARSLQNGRGVLRAPAAVQDAWLHQPHAACTVRRRCQLLAVARRGSDAWRRRPPRAQAPGAQEGQAHLPRAVAQGRGPSGTRRLTPRLAQDGRPGSRRRLGRWRAQAGQRGKTRRTCTAPKPSGPAAMVAPHPRHRALTVQEPETVAGGARPALPTGDGWLELALVRARCARAVVGWSMADQRRAEWVHQACGLASCQRRPAAGLRRPTDRGRPYGAESSRHRLAPPGRPPRLRRKGTGGDNAGAQSVLHPVKTALVSREDVETREQAEAAVVAYIAVFSNRQRCHAAHGSLAP